MSDLTLDRARNLLDNIHRHIDEALAASKGDLSVALEAELRSAADALAVQRDADAPPDGEPPPAS